MLRQYFFDKCWAGVPVNCLPRSPLFWILRLVLFAGLLMGRGVQSASAAESAAVVERWVVPSWGDVVCLYGPGTDASMDSPAAIEKTFRRWMARGFTGITLRTDLVDFEPMIVRNNSTEQNPRLQLLLDYIDFVSGQFNVMETAQQKADIMGFKMWAWHPYIYSDGAPANIGTPGLGRMIPWPYCSKYFIDHPEGLTVDRQGNKLWMVREFAYPEARASKVAEFVYMAQTFGLKRFLSCMRSEVNQLVDPPLKADQYGFNTPVVAEMQSRYGVNILTDTRFDVFSASFNLQDAMVENWRKLRGEHITQFYRELRSSLNAVDPSIEIAVTLSGEYVGPPLGNQRLDWRTWVDEGLIDAIIMPVYFEATLDGDAAQKGYLTNVRAGLGVISHSEIKDYISRSPHPEIKIIATGAAPYFNTAPPTGADGWRVDVWYDLYTSAWCQRWSQWMTDVKDLGSIRFLQQNFDTFPTDSSLLPPAGSYGTVAHDPSLRACPGGWYTFGNSASGKAFIQSTTRRGSSGNAVRLTSNGAGGPSFVGYHASDADRSNIASVLDTAITSGTADYSVWLYRESSASGVITYLENTGAELDVGLKIESGTGKVYYTTGRNAGGEGTWQVTPYTMPVGAWQRFSIRVNFATGSYSAYAGASAETLLMSGIPYSPPPPRTTMQNGVNIEIPVPSYKTFKQVQFQPLGSAGSKVYLDEVSVLWTPEQLFAQSGEQIQFADDFEQMVAGASLNDSIAKQGGMWKTLPTAGGSIPDNSCQMITSNSYREGEKSVLVTSPGDLVPLLSRAVTLGTSGVVTFEVDLFLRSDSSSASLIPYVNTTSSNRVRLIIERDQGDHPTIFSADAFNGKWFLSNNSLNQESPLGVPYDCWVQIQLSIDAVTRTCVLVQQQIGQVAQKLGTVPFPADFQPGQLLAFRINLGSATSSVTLDNVKIAARETVSSVVDPALNIASNTIVPSMQNASGVTFAGAGYALSGGMINLTGSTPTITLSANGLSTISSILAGTDGFTLEGFSSSRTLAISGNNTGLSGRIIVEKGILRLSNSNALGDSAAEADGLLLSGGDTVLQLTSGVALNKYLTVGGGVATIQAHTGNSSLIGQFNSDSQTVFVLDSVNTLTLSGAAGLGRTGSTIMAVGTGTLVVDAPSAGSVPYGFFIRSSAIVKANPVPNPFGSANLFMGDDNFGYETPTTPTLLLNGGTVANNFFLSPVTTSRRVGNSATTGSSLSGQVFLESAADVTLASLVENAKLTVSGNIRDDANTAGVVIGTAGFANLGKVDFTRASGNSYDGTTTVNSGTLLANNASGSATGTGAVLVNRGAVLGGSGVISGSTTISGSLRPGNSIGTISIGNTVTWNSGDSWVFELGTAGASQSSPGMSDSLNITAGNFNKGTGSSWTFDFAGTGARGWYKLVDWSGTSNFSASDFVITNLTYGLSGRIVLDTVNSVLSLEVTDGLSDYERWAIGYGLSSVQGLGSADPDSDGLRNEVEFAFGGNPVLTDAGVIDVRKTVGGVTITFVSRDSGITYEVQSTTDLANGSWVSAEGTITNDLDQSRLSVGHTRKSFSVSSADMPTRMFYRVRATFAP